MKKDRNPAVKMGNVTDLSNGTLDIEEQKKKKRLNAVQHPSGQILGSWVETRKETLKGCRRHPVILDPRYQFGLTKAFLSRLRTPLPEAQGKISVLTDDCSYWGIGPFHRCHCAPLIRVAGEGESAQTPGYAALKHHSQPGSHLRQCHLVWVALHHPEEAVAVGEEVWALMTSVSSSLLQQPLHRYPFRLPSCA